MTGLKSDLLRAKEDVDVNDKHCQELERNIAELQEKLDQYVCARDCSPFCSFSRAAFYHPLNRAKSQMRRQRYSMSRSAKSRTCYVHTLQHAFR